MNSSYATMSLLTELRDLGHVTRTGVQQDQNQGRPYELRERIVDKSDNN